MRTAFRILTASALLMWPVEALADGAVTSTIAKVHTSGPTNYAFRVIMAQDESANCLGNYLYINTSDGNYQAVVATLLTAFSLQKTVYITWANDGGYTCRIVDAEVSR